MGEKKRKGSLGATDLPLKKSKKSKSTDATKDPVEPKPVSTTEPTAAFEVESRPSNDASTKKSRKRAADFMNEEEETTKTAAPLSTGEVVEEPTSKKSKKSKKNKKSKQDELLTADGVNGVVEHPGDEDLETATAQKPVTTSMQAEAERTVDQELEEDFRAVASEDEAGYVDEVPADDNAAALLAGFDSDSEDEQQDAGLDLTTTPALPQSKKVRKKLDKLKAEGKDDGPGAVYVGRVPHGFYEKQMREYFSQFGDITRLRLSRNKRTGASKHYAFIEFSSNEVAKIVAETMDNYLLFGHILKCKYAPPESLHPDVWVGANKKYRKIPHEKLEGERLAAPKPADKWQKKVDKEQRRREEKAKKLKAIGLDMPESTLTRPEDVVQEKLITAEEPKLVEDQEPAPAALTEATTEGTEKESKKDKKAKKDKKDKKKKIDGDEDKEMQDQSAENVAASEPATADSIEAAGAEASKGAKAAKSAKEPQLSKKERKALKKAETMPDSDLAKDERKALKNAQKKLARFDPKESNELTTAAEQPVEVEAVVAEVKAPVVNGVDTAEEAKSPKTDSKAAKKLAKKAAKAKKDVTETVKVAETEEKPVQAAASAESPEPAQTAEPAALGTDADFVSFGEYNDEQEAGASESDSGDATRATLSNASRGPKGKKYKEKKEKKERKNLVKARGPKSKLVPIQPKPDTTVPGKLPGVPLLGKGKYDKATRQAHKELKNKVLKNKKGPRGSAAGGPGA
ncbi:hypothetical protein A1O1_06441 [Capronia coronata CBS 617.96]|uniref:RRM domain-containing protein n=1 Tax=Capronia coronata CBS 617.96 TaxID=1182541 RepID=W9XZT4_9EURO|nr:uncharacterized protein A1O1_06441 [Capronia coronata CBS 617.96]EXJ86072.1 hypothetical protein A1O1_06441 [Capronia coronata CBS 617.96]